MDRAFGVEVTLIARLRPPEEREAWRVTGWDPRDGIAELYGRVEPPPGLRVIVADEDRLIRPAEDPSLTLLPIDRLAGDDVLTTRTLRYRAAALGLALGLLGALLLWIGTRRQASFERARRARTNERTARPT